MNQGEVCLRPAETIEKLEVVRSFQRFLAPLRTDRARMMVMIRKRIMESARAVLYFAS